MLQHQYTRRISRIERLVKDFLKIDSVPKSRRNGSAFKRNVEYFMVNVDTLFDIFYKNNSQRRRLEKDKLLRMNNIGFAFYENQKGARIGKYTSIQEKPNNPDLTFIKRASQQRLTKNKDQHPVAKCNIIEGKTNTCGRNAVVSKTKSVGESFLRCRQPATTSSFRNKTEEH